MTNRAQTTAAMNTAKPKTRTEAAAPKETQHLDDEELHALDLSAEAEHTDGRKREQMTRQVQDHAGVEQPD